MILEHLIKKSDFKKYVESIEIPVNLQQEITSTITWKKERYLIDCVTYSNQLGALCIDNWYARKEKKKLIERVLSYLLRKNLHCEDVFYNLYSDKTPDAEQKRLKLIDRYHKGFLVRQQYLKALDEIHRNSSKLSRLFKQFYKTAKYPPYRDDEQLNFSQRRYSIQFLQKTKKHEGKKLTGVMSYTELAVWLREKKTAELNISGYTNDEIKALWLRKEYSRLSNGNLKKLGNLICDAYRSIYDRDINENRNEKKREYNQKRYVPRKSLSAREKKDIIMEMKAMGRTQKETVEMTDISRSTVERNWNNG